MAGGPLDPIAGLHLSASHLGRISDQLAFEPQRRNNGIIVVYGDGIFGWSHPTGTSGSAAITLSLESFDLPDEENAVLELNYMNEVHKVASKGRAMEINVTVKDFVDTMTLANLQRWRRMVYNPTDTLGGNPVPTIVPPYGGLGLARDYKKRAEILLFGPNGGYQRVYKCEGVWPSKLSHGQIDMTSQEQVMIELVLQVDRISDHDLVVGDPYPAFP